MISSHLLILVAPTIILMIYNPVFKTTNPCPPQSLPHDGWSSGTHNLWSNFDQTSPFYNCPEWSFLLTWDDETNFVTNESIRSLSKENVWSWITDVKINVFEPVGWLLKGIVVEIYSGGDGSGEPRSEWFRQATVLIHCANAALLFSVVFNLIRLLSDPKAVLLPARLTAVTVATLWGAHPVNVEVIGWPSSQPYSIACFFVLLAILFHTNSLRNVKTPMAITRTKHVVTAVLLFLGCMSKSAVVTSPAVIPLIDFSYAYKNKLRINQYQVSE